MDTVNLLSENMFWLEFGFLTAFWLFLFFPSSVSNLVLLAALLLHITVLIIRGVTIGFLPLTNKFESFYTFSLMVLIVFFWRRDFPGRTFKISLFSIGYGGLVVSSFFPKAINFPPPLMLTIWYALHVPLSFLSYALWASAFSLALNSLSHPDSSPLCSRLMASDSFYGFLAFSVSMIFGGLWGFVAWGSYFIWDPKIIWSVILWIFYATFIHIDAWPVMRRKKAHLLIVGFVFILITYVGTSFFANSSHSF